MKARPPSLRFAHDMVQVAVDLCLCHAATLDALAAVLPNRAVIYRAHAEALRCAARLLVDQTAARVR